MVKPTQLKVTVKNYLDGIDQKKLLGTKCKKCGFIEVPAKSLCTECLSDEIEIIEVKPEGKLAAFTCIGVGTTYFVEKGYSMKRPYCFAIVELENGKMVSGQLIGGEISYKNDLPYINGTEIKVGLPVKGEFEEYKEEQKDRSGNKIEITHCRLKFTPK
ncbi:MAG: Zn-ribbon domain-containing OB-fold protein [Promethearchaeota archaeon]